MSCNSSSQLQYEIRKQQRWSQESPDAPDPLHRSSFHPHAQSRSFPIARAAGSFPVAAACANPPLPFPIRANRYTAASLRARSFPGHCGEHELIPAPQAVGYAGSRLWPAGATAKPRVRAGSTSSSLSVRRGWSALVRSLGGSGTGRCLRLSFATSTAT